MTPPMTPTPAVSAKEKAREAVADILKMRDEALFTGDAFEADEAERRETAEMILAALSATEGEAEPVACGVYPPPETYGGSPNDEWSGRPPSAPARMKVKPLEWQETPSGYFWMALSAVGRYFIEERHSDFRWNVEGWPGWWAAHTLDEAKADAQADYEQRIRSSLQPDTQAAAASAPEGEDGTYWKGVAERALAKQHDMQREIDEQQTEISDLITKWDLAVRAGMEDAACRGVLVWFEGEPEWWETPREFRDKVKAAMAPIASAPAQEGRS